MAYHDVQFHVAVGHLAVANPSPAAELTKLKSDVERLRKMLEPRQYGLKPVSTDDALRYADRVEVDMKDPYGIRFRFKDSTGHLHGEYRVDDPIAPAPKSAIGAAKMLWQWFWILDLNEEAARALEETK